MQTILITLHNLTRWLVLIFGALAVARAFAGWLGKKGWQKADDRAGMLFTGMLDLQLLLGLALYFTSPFMQPIFRDFGVAMAGTSLRFFGVVHAGGMLLAILIAHAARSLSRKAASDPLKHQRSAIGFGLALLIVAILIPWMRPLLQFFGLLTV
ncbi:hypothetical protein LARV_00243 [Longilinea arvoryzae]|uniref:Uncharacterized protein n=1 Tax=Longilinea arvoryzae TaxID=360412 RepID=A0A0S7BFD4_9CHLR|nr:hypothetical protein LARV_00243 [Longilinea arvoryzae]